jgi:osmotically-inducible protein OsmY
MNSNRNTFPLLATLLAGAALATTACDRPASSGRATLDADRSVATATVESVEPRERAANDADSDVKARVHMALLAEPNLKSQRIFVDVSEGVITLSGVVDSVALRDRAKQLVHGAAGVTPIVDLMVVKATASG